MEVAQALLAATTSCPLGHQVYCTACWGMLRCMSMGRQRSGSLPAGGRHRAGVAQQAVKKHSPKRQWLQAARVTLSAPGTSRASTSPRLASRVAMQAMAASLTSWSWSWAAKRRITQGNSTCSTLPYRQRAGTLLTHV